MSKRLIGSRRGLTKKVTSINFFVDQATQIQAIMEATGETKEAPLVRRLVDEALAARRRKSVRPAEPDQPPPTQDTSETLQTLQTLMLRMLGQGESTSQMVSVSLELLQEAVAEGRSGKMNVWEFLVADGLRDRGESSGKIAQLFEARDEDGKQYAYGLAEEIKKEMDAEESDPTSNTLDEDRQESFTHEAS